MQSYWSFQRLGNFIEDDQGRELGLPVLTYMFAFDRIVEEALPLVYSFASAATIFHLSRKPVHLDQYTPLNDDYLVEESEELSDGAGVAEATSIDQVQAQYQAQRSSGMSINIARLVLTAFQLAHGLFSIALLSADRNDDDRDGRSTFWADAVNVLAWSYALTLSFLYVLRPLVAYQFWIRPQLDLFYLLEFVLVSIQLFTTDILSLPLTEWPLWLQLNGIAWVGIVLLLWNAVVPDVFGAPTLTYWQAVGLLLLTQILFRGIGRWHASHHPSARDRWKHKLEEKLAAMTPEEREQFRSEWKRRCGWDPDKSAAESGDLSH